MKQKKDGLTLLLIALMSIMAIIALFVLFGDAFDDASRGSVFYAMFGSASKNRAAVPGLIVGFALLIAAIVLPLTSPLFDNKGKTFVFLLEALLLAVAGVLYLFTTKFYVAANSISYGYNMTLGAGSICATTFSFIGVAFALLGALRMKKAQ
jgi:hypothetical protein